EITGIDHEAGFLEQARARAAGRPGRFTYLQATGEALPFEDGRFDVVTCQTVLMHVADARATLAEMWRVTRPGGLVVLSEPNNLVDPIPTRVALGDLETGELARQVAFEAACVRGRAALGKGDAIVGERLGGYLHELGCEAPEVWTNDACGSLYPPYARPRERLLVDALRGWAALDVSQFGRREDTLAFYLAGGGDEAAFEPLWEAAVAAIRRSVAGIDAGTYQTAGGVLMYLVAGRKPG
ncbi:MAG: class I SAM-dependent methyltransferase, partial [Myxococcales bacterium]|nr:class I SAM-dependent methyltransferase [Myxococcales bacterium]